MLIPSKPIATGAMSCARLALESNFLTCQELPVAARAAESCTASAWISCRRCATLASADPAFAYRFARTQTRRSRASPRLEHMDGTASISRWQTMTRWRLKAAAAEVGFPGRPVLRTLGVNSILMLGPADLGPKSSPFDEALFSEEVPLARRSLRKAGTPKAPGRRVRTVGALGECAKCCRAQGVRRCTHLDTLRWLFQNCAGTAGIRPRGPGAGR